MPLLEEERNTTRPLLGEEPAEIDFEALDAAPDPKQRRQMLIALGLLLLALILVIVKDRDFWFPAARTVESEPVDQPSPDLTEQAKTQTPATPPVAAKRPKAKPHAPAPVAAAAAKPQPTSPPAVASRAVLPPLEVEVVAGDQRRTVQSGSSSIKVDLQSRSVAPSEIANRRASGLPAPSTGVSPARTTERVHLSPGAAEVISRPVDPSYPLLAKQMKVQGSVVLQAFIAKDGNIQDLRVLSGPTILSTAAREAVKQWRFRPYLVAGQPVETEARITVNFTISTQ